MDAEGIAQELFGLDARATPLPGERDLNFRLEAADGSRHLLKLHHPDVDREVLDLQDAALAHLAEAGAPRLVGRGEHDGRVVRLLSWIDGRPWADGGPHGVTHLTALGRLVGRVDAALAGFSHRAMRRSTLWNLASAPDVARFAHLIADDGRRASVEAVLARHPRLDALPHQVLHNDANEHNILVADDGTPAALIDFGDLVWSARVCGPAVAAAYAMQGQADPVGAAAALLAGYDQVAPLTTDELAVAFDLMRSRLAVSICMAARGVAADPGNEYLLVSQAGIWAVLEAVADYDADLAHFRFRDACGYDANPSARAIRQHLSLTAAATPMDAERAGGYGEQRDWYTAPQFALADGRRRTLHLGVDLWAPAGTPVRAALAGVVHAAAVNPLPLDYGGVVILEHATDGGIPFWTLYGHLAPPVLTPGDAIAAGEPVGVLGTEEENGGWEPHLHLQLLTSLIGAGADVPGVAAADEADLWQSISPDPNLLLGGPGGDTARVARETPEIARRRAAALSPALSLAYAEPLHIVRGEGAHLYGADGRAWLDLVNNVAHVGHCHPRVVAAGQRQMAQLNTNTRYLHDSVVTYARRLAAELPDPLRVVFFVNSGSEANDLALRLARAHTGREDVVVLDHAYHGHLSSLVDISPYKFNRAGGAGRPAGTHVLPLPTDATVPDLPPAAALFAESLPGVAGQIVLPDGYLAAGFAKMRAAGGVCVADEVQVGFGRVGSRFWGFELGGVVPDIVTLGKPIGNGHPLAAVVTTPDIAKSFVTGMEYFNTFGGNPVSAEIGLAVLDVIRDERLQAHARDVGEHLLEGLRALRHPQIVEVRGAGLFIGVELTDAAIAAHVKEAMKARGVLVSTDGPRDNVIKVKPPLVITRDDADTALEALDSALSRRQSPPA